MEFGIGPDYNAAYRSIRWPGADRKIRVLSKRGDFQEEIVDKSYIVPFLSKEDILGINTPLILFSRQAPSRTSWKRDLRYDLSRKTAGNFFGQNTLFSADTRYNLISDLRHCMRNNIPFKTLSVEYKPLDQRVYLKGIPVVQYDLETGYVKSFNLQGVYNKVINFLLRTLFNLKIIKTKKGLVWNTFDPYTTLDIIRGTTKKFSGIDDSIKHNFPNISKCVPIELDKEYILPYYLMFEACDISVREHNVRSIMGNIPPHENRPRYASHFLYGDLISHYLANEYSFFRGGHLTEDTRIIYGNSEGPRQTPSVTEFREFGNTENSVFRNAIVTQPNL